MAKNFLLSLYAQNDAQREITPKSDRLRERKGVFCRGDGPGMVPLVSLWRPGGLLKLKSLLVVDSFHQHIGECVKRAVANAERQLAIIPGGLTPVFSLWTLL